ncbi:MAG: ABC transporter ATP-binding protein [Propionibacteriaceae bacterium]|nr:ABC transporter ATP-binding protein [Propionibacteriaceae bacterium]
MTLEVKNLSYSYGRHQVLNNVSLTAAEGQCVCLLGANGAGKTTLFRCVLGLLSGYSGDILLDGESCRQLSVRELARRIAYVPQAHSPAFNYSVFDTVLMGTSVLTDVLRTPGASEADVAQKMLEMMQIADLADRGFAELSGGERQLVLISRALAQQSRVIVMDEPTANLDYGNQLMVMRQAKQLAGQGYLVVLSTHSPELALLFADQVIVLDDGVIDASGDAQTVLTPAVIHKTYGVTVELHQVPTTWGDVPMVVPDVGLYDRFIA